MCTRACNALFSDSGTMHSRPYHNYCYCCKVSCVTSIKIIKNEVGCRDDTVPKTGDTRRHCEVELTVCNNLPQPLKNEM